jgi:ribose transport system permease protein
VAFNHTFISRSNWASILAVASPFIITAAAQAPVTLAGNGGIDLSVGPLAGLVNVIIIAVLIAHGISSPLPVLLIGLALGGGSGLLNGFLVSYMRIQPIIATLGTYLFYSGLALYIIPTAGGSAPGWLTHLAGSYGPIPGMVIPLGTIAIVWLALTRTAFRRNLLAVGGDERVAYTAGINVAAVRTSAYILTGLLAAVAGIVLTAVLGSADPTVGPPYTLTSIAGMALGGVSLAGGRGGLLGAAAGGAVLFLVQNLLTLAQVSIFHLQIAYGVILIVALVLNSLGDRFRRHRLTASAVQRAG